MNSQQHSQFVPAEQQCRQCGDRFVVETFDQELLDKLSPVFGANKYSIPLPTHCPECRLQRRMIWRGELHLFNRKSALSGKPFISYFPPEAPGRVFSREDFFSDTWDGCDYGREIDFTRPFFEQFEELLHAAPLLGLTGLNNENSDYINNGTSNKNCYLTAAANYNEDCYYANYVNHSKSCIDNIFLLRCELCYECVSCVECYNLLFSDQCNKCTDSAFLFDCRRCQHCFGCVNMVNAKYCFFNEQLTPAEYHERVAALELHSRANLEAVRERVNLHRVKCPHRAIVADGTESCTGNFIYFSRNAQQCFDVNNVEDCRYCFWLHDSKDCMDIYCFGLPGELCYECSGVGANAYHNLFCYQCTGSRELMYSAFSNASSNCFGCVGMIRKEYCILNRQYTKEDYGIITGRLIAHMRETGEWGEFFPMRLSPLSYNSSVAQDYYPLERTDAELLGLRWHEEPPNDSAPLAAMPDSLNDLDSSHLKHSFRCGGTGKSFRLLPRELQFLKEHNIAPPALSFLERHAARLARRNPRRLWERTCGKCGEALQSTYAAFRPEKIYCSNCFEHELYGN